jgi:hypothetical protein
VGIATESGCTACVASLSANPIGAATQRAGIITIVSTSPAGAAKGIRVPSLAEPRGLLGVGAIIDAVATYRLGSPATSTRPTRLEPEAIEDAQAAATIAADHYDGFTVIARKQPRRSLQLHTFSGSPEEKTVAAVRAAAHDRRKRYAASGIGAPEELSNPLTLTLCQRDTECELRAPTGGERSGVPASTSGNKGH